MAKKENQRCTLMCASRPASVSLDVRVLRVSFFIKKGYINGRKLPPLFYKKLSKPALFPAASSGAHVHVRQDSANKKVFSSLGSGSATSSGKEAQQQQKKRK